MPECLMPSKGEQECGPNLGPRETAYNYANSRILGSLTYNEMAVG